MEEGNSRLFKSWTGDLAFGDKREQDFMAFFNGFMTKGSGRIEDLLLQDGKTLELKSERYYILDTPPPELKMLNPMKMWKTQNLFIEMVANKPCGPWRAEKDNVDYYVHLFLDDIAFIFHSKSLCKWLKTIPQNKYRHFTCINEAKSGKWKATGWLIPALDLAQAGICKVIRLEKNKDYSYLFKDLEKYKK